MRITLTRTLTTITLAALVTACSTAAVAPAPPAVPTLIAATTAPAPTVALTAAATTPLSQPASLASAADLEELFDSVIPTQLAELDIMGAAVMVVKDGELLLAKGYGYTDLERDVPVVAERTLFRTGSVGKLFTWTAVM